MKLFTSDSFLALKHNVIQIIFKNSSFLFKINTFQISDKDQLIQSTKHSVYKQLLISHGNQLTVSSKT